jgi:hypothetical protein
MLRYQAASTPTGSAAIRWAARKYGGDDWLVISEEPPETIGGGRNSWVVELDRVGWPDDAPTMIVEVQQFGSRYMVRDDADQGMPFLLPKAGQP